MKKNISNKKTKLLVDAFVRHSFAFTNLLLSSASPETPQHFLQIMNKLSSNSVKISLHKELSWTSITNLCYIVFDISDGNFYIGETSLSLSQRLYGHASTHKSPVGKLLRTRPHTITACPLLYINRIARHGNKYNLTKLRKRIEFLLIRTLNPPINRTNLWNKKSSTNFSPKLQRNILRKLSHQAPTLFKTGKLKKYSISLQDGTTSSGFSLNVMLAGIPSESVVTIEEKERGYDITDYQELRKNFGDSRQVPDLKKMCPFNLGRRLPTSPIAILICNPRAVDPTKILASHSITGSFETLANLSLAPLLTRESRANLKKILMSRFDVKILSKYEFKLPLTLNIDTRDLQLEIESWLSTLPIYKISKEIVRLRLKITRQNPETLGDSLCNFREFDRKYLDASTYTCVCDKPEGKHVNLLASTHSSHLVRNLASLGSNFVPPASKKDIYDLVGKTTTQFSKIVFEASPKKLEILLHDTQEDTTLHAIPLCTNILNSLKYQGVILSTKDIYSLPCTPTLATRTLPYPT